jgi:hypothetical protein
MMPAWLFWTLVAVVLIGLYLSQTAGRLDRLHVRVDRARQDLDAQLLRRSAAAAELAAANVLDPASSMVVADAAQHARIASDDERSDAETTLTVALNAALPDSAAVSAVVAHEGGDDLITELAGTTRRVELAGAFLDDAVRSCLLVRERPLVRVLRLAGRAPWPTALEFDGRQPDGLATATTAG